MLLIYVVSFFYITVVQSVLVDCLFAEAAYRFFKTKSEEDSLKRNGKAEIKKVCRRRQERLTRVSFFYCSVCILCLSVSVHLECVCVTAKLRGSNLLFSIISKHEKDAVCNFTQVEHLSVQNPCHFVNG